MRVSKRLNKMAPKILNMRVSTLMESHCLTKNSLTRLGTKETAKRERWRIHGA